MTSISFLRKRVLVLAGFDHSLVNFRGPLLQAMVEAGHEVVAAAPVETPGLSSRLDAIGVRFIPTELERAGMNPLKDRRYEQMLEKVFRRERPDVVLAYTIKPVIHGMLAAARAGVPGRYALITGLGAAFHTGGLKGACLRFAASWLYRRSLRHCTRIIVQNEDIAEYFLRRDILPDRSRVLVVAGSGIDTDHFAEISLPMGPPVFLLLARMLRDKGIGEFVAAAAQVKAQIPSARFLLVGSLDPNPAAISAAQLEQWIRQGAVEYHDAVADVRPLLAQCTTYVLPSYHEGMPRSVLEAMAVGRPVITTDAIGCRETVINAGQPDADGVRAGENGLLVPVKSVEPLTQAMLRLARNPGMCARLGSRGREIALERFDVQQINRQMLRAMDLGGQEKLSARH